MHILCKHSAARRCACEVKIFAAKTLHAIQNYERKCGLHSAQSSWPWLHAMCMGQNGFRKPSSSTKRPIFSPPCCLMKLQHCCTHLLCASVFSCSGVSLPTMLFQLGKNYLCHVKNIPRVLYSEML